MRTTLGLDIGRYAIKAVVAKPVGDSVVIDRVACRVLPPALRADSASPTQLQPFVADLVRQIGKGVRAIAAGMSTGAVQLKTLQVETGLDDERLEGDIQLALLDFVPFAPHEIYVDFVRLGNVASSAETEPVLVAVSRRESVDPIAAAIATKSIQQPIIDVAVFALAKVLNSAVDILPATAYAVLDIGYLSSTFSVFLDGNLLFFHEQAIGGHQLSEAIAEAQHCPIATAEQIKHDEFHTVPAAVKQAYFTAFAEQTALTLALFTSQHEVDLHTLYLTGGGSLTDGLFNALCQAIPQPALAILPIGQAIGIGKKVSGMTPENIAAQSALATGLSVRWQ